MTVKGFFKWLFPKGFIASWSSGKAFDPTYQERTNGIQDIIKAKEEREKEKIK